MIDEKISAGGDGAVEQIRRAEGNSMLSTKDRAETCKDQIRAFLASNFYIADADALESHTSLLDQGIVDSAGVLEVIGFIEESFGITVEDSELLPENLDSIQGIAQYILRKQN
nr:acyl carrier protein [Mesorhizobium sp.]